MAGNGLDIAYGGFGNDDINSDTPLDKQRHACATSKLHGLLGYQPWSQTS